MCKFVIALLLLAVCHQVYANPAPFRVYRSDDIKLNKDSHRESSFSAFNANGEVQADLAGPPNAEGDLSETHPIDFSRIKLGGSRKAGGIDSMQNDEIPSPTDRFNRRRPKARFGSRSTDGSAASRFGALLNSKFYCEQSAYLSECLRLRLSSKFLKRLTRSNRPAADDLRNTMEDLNRISSSLDRSPPNSAKAARSIEQARQVLDRTFYDGDFLNPLVSECISSYQSKCGQATHQTLFQ